VDRLLAEFHTELRRKFRAYHQFPLYIWPGFEEYSVLYADYYEQRPFPFRLNLPPPGEALPFRLVWSESVRFEPTTGGYRVGGLHGETEVGEGALVLLARPLAPMPVDQLLDKLASALPPADGEQSGWSAALRGVIDRLLSVGALRLEPALDPVAQGV
jgi:hypothetical protein